MIVVNGSIMSINKPKQTIFEAVRDDIMVNKGHHP